MRTKFKNWFIPLKDRAFLSDMFQIPDQRWWKGKRWIANIKKAIFSIHSLTGTLLLIALVSAFALAFSPLHYLHSWKRTAAAGKPETVRAVQIQRLTDTSDYLTSQLWYNVVTQKSQKFLNYWKEIEDGRNRERAINVLTDNNITDNECFFANKAKKNLTALSI